MWIPQTHELAIICQMFITIILQAKLDEKRAEINVPREAFRQKYLEAERKRLEEIAAAEASLRAETEKAAPSPKGKKSGKKSPKASGKSGKKK